MDNQKIAKIFNEIASFLEIDNIPFKPQAYKRAADTLFSLNEDVKTIYDKGGLKALENLEGIGKSLAERIEEYLKTGKIRYYEDLKKVMPVDFSELTQVEGLGAKKVRELFLHLGVRNLEDLERAARQGKIKDLERFGVKTEQNILEGIEFFKRSKGRFLLGEILPIVRDIEDKLKVLKEVEKVEVCGSVRRMKETIGDVDLLVQSSNPSKVMDFFVSLPGVEKVWGKGETKASVRMEDGFDVDVRVVPKKSYGAALQYFTGSKEHNIVVRELAIRKGLKLNEYGLFEGKKMIAGADEEGIYKALGMKLMPPEIRENGGEVEASLKDKLPQLVKLQDIKGDFHCHSNFNGGHSSVRELAEYAKSLNYEYLGISDHTKFLRIENGLDEKGLSLERKEIDKINGEFEEKGDPFRILQGCECNILDKGELDISDEALAKLDYVIAGVHSQFKMGRKEMTERIINAMKNPNVKIIAHPTGRLLKKRDEYEIDFDKVLRAARGLNVILEIDSFPQRFDLSDVNIRRAKEAGVKMTIDTDSHQKEQLYFMEYGVSQARRGWAEKKDIVNTLPFKKLIEEFKKR